MTIQEFSDTFDTMLNSYNLQAGFGEGTNKASITLDEYEKSVLLTQAQDNIIKSYFDRSMNHQNQGFDDSIMRQVDFSSLIHVYRFMSIVRNSSNSENCYDRRGIPVTLDCNPKILTILNEKLEALVYPKNGTGGTVTETYIVVPINYKEYDREMSKAYGQPLKKQAWRLFSNTATGYDIQSEIIPIEGLTDRLPSISDDLDYVIRYVGRPTPIILTALPNNLTIDGYSGAEPAKVGEKDSPIYDNIFTGNGINCSLNPILHMDILNKAFELAINTRGGGTYQRQQDNDNQRQ